MAFLTPLPLLNRSTLLISAVKTSTQLTSTRRLSLPTRRRIVPSCTQLLRPSTDSTTSPASRQKPSYTKPSAAPRLAAEGDSLQSTQQQRLLLLTFGVVSLATFAQVCSHIHSGVEATLDVLLVLASYVFTDFAIGVYHHAVDNYGSKHTPLVGYQIEAFQGHHEYPWTITSRDMANNLHRLTVVTIPQMLILLSVPFPASFKAFYSAFLVFIVLSQETHRQAHMTRAAPWVRALQRVGLIVSQKAHAAHHRSSGAYEGNYCILSGWWNNFLDQSGFFRLHEAIIYKLTGNEPICWRLDSSLKADAIRRLPRLWR